MKLEVGMYVRTNLGNIGKIVKEYTHQNYIVSYPEPQEWVLDTGYVLNEALMYNNEDIIKASYNIIDLIEAGDYVNGYKIYSIYDDDKYVNEYNLKHKKCLGKNIYDEDYQEYLIYELYIVYIFHLMLALHIYNQIHYHIVLNTYLYKC